MTWNTAGTDEVAVAEAVILWIRTARDAGHGEGWLPTAADIRKSALFERLRSGKQPLPFPPPLGMSCPWYALVEDPEPQFVGRMDGFGPVFGTEGADLPGAGRVSVMQSLYDIVERRSDTDMVVRDAMHGPGSPWTFRLWHDPDWKLPPIAAPGSRGALPPGGWFLRNMTFCVPETSAA